MSHSTTTPALDLFDGLFVGFDDSLAAVEWNRSLRESLAYDDASLAGLTPAELFADADAADVRAALDGAPDTGETTLDASLVTAAGERIPCHVTVAALPEGSAAGAVACVCQPNAEDAHRALRERERVLRRIYEITSDRERTFEEQVSAVLDLAREQLDVAYGTLSKIEGEEYTFEVVSSADDRVTEGMVVPLSATNCEVAATTERTLVLGDVARDAPEQTDRAGYTDMGIACYLGAPVFVDEGVYGTLCFYDTEPRDGQFSEWEVTLVDLLSRWVSYEVERRQMNERLQRRNERLDRFASIVSHDLRNPLNIIVGTLELAEETGDAEHFERAWDTIDRMDELIDDLLTLARSGTVIGDPEPVALRAVASAAWKHVETDAATLSVETEATVLADASRLQQVLENLFRNAVEHGGPTVTVRVGDCEGGFYVADDGVGIPADEHGQVFEDGYSTLAEGTGFGLAIAAEIADAHGWTVSVTEGEGGGARFEFAGVERAQRAD
ncbi:GAF domain-containing sensor histidine kinase [Halarchaeum sp. P4]|uniref:sensor histidine kinase n=1 Tax=Halarchaeum sp. P4 TaxID=3421639 RepID=UPI003EBDECE0